MLDMASAKTCMTEHGMRMTPQRREILGFLCGNTEHPRIEDLTAHVRRTLPDISVSTIYKNVHELASIGLIQELAHHDGHRLDPRTDLHAHLHCHSCGRLMDVELEHETLLSLRESVGSLGGTLQTVDVTIEGTCPSCVARQENRA
ncbi:MAG: transcriptional repressor [Coriobacteriales bacterium]|jgi:Fe2+ or Zn2+ uptake regulation protein|nr:transcriptional repressor [Coriobacteriales bacterium]